MGVCFSLWIGLCSQFFLNCIYFEWGGVARFLIAYDFYGLFCYRLSTVKTNPRASTYIIPGIQDTTLNMKINQRKYEQCWIVHILNFYSYMFSSIPPGTSLSVQRPSHCSFNFAFPHSTGKQSWARDCVWLGNIHIIRDSGISWRIKSRDRDFSCWASACSTSRHLNLMTGRIKLNAGIRASGMQSDDFVANNIWTCRKTRWNSVCVRVAGAHERCVSPDAGVAYSTPFGNFEPDRTLMDQSLRDIWRAEL